MLNRLLATKVSLMAGGDLVQVTADGSVLHGEGRGEGAPIPHC
jgi:hypothetical protein